MNEPKRRGRPPKAPEAPNVSDRAQAYARRVYNGFSPMIHHNERIEFVKQALATQNLPFDGVQLP